MGKKIERLNKEQLDRILVEREEWIKTGLSIGDCDREKVNVLIDDVYKVAGLEPSKIKIWLRSPLEGCIGASILSQAKVLDQVESQVRNQVGYQVSDQVWAKAMNQVRNQVSEQVSDQVRNQVSQQVMDQVGYQVGYQVLEQVLAQAGDNVWKQVGDKARDKVSNQVLVQVEDKIKDKVRDKVSVHVVDKVRKQVLVHVCDKVCDKVLDQVMEQVMEQVLEQVWNKSEIQARKKVCEYVSKQVSDQVVVRLGHVDKQVREQVRAQVLDQVLVQVGDKGLDQVLDQVYRCGYGIHDAGWLSFYSYFSRYIGLEKIQPLIELSKAVGWWWPFNGAVILTEMPIYILMDDDGRLHGEDRKAIEYSDGFGVYVWHGVRVPRHIIEEPDKLTTDMVLKEENQEVRRVMLERYGYDRLLKELGAMEESSDRFGVLYSTTRLGEYLDGEDKVAKFVLVDDSSTDRRYVLRVDPNSKTAHDGVASTFGRTAEQYNPIQEA